MKQFLNKQLGPFKGKEWLIIGVGGIALGLLIRYRFSKKGDNVADDGTIEIMGLTNPAVVGGTDYNQGAIVEEVLEHLANDPRFAGPSNSPGTDPDPNPPNPPNLDDKPKDGIKWPNNNDGGKPNDGIKPRNVSNRIAANLLGLGEVNPLLLPKTGIKTIKPPTIPPPGIVK